MGLLQMICSNKSMNKNPWWGQGKLSQEQVSWYALVSVLFSWDLKLIIWTIRLEFLAGGISKLGCGRAVWDMSTHPWFLTKMWAHTQHSGLVLLLLMDYGASSWNCFVPWCYTYNIVSLAGIVTTVPFIHPSILYVIAVI